MDRERNLPSFRLIGSKMSVLNALRSIPNVAPSNYASTLEEIAVLMVSHAPHPLHFIYFLFVV